jgi:putative salt-induced outer membrane protein YdiY
VKTIENLTRSDGGAISLGRLCLILASWVALVSARPTCPRCTTHFAAIAISVWLCLNPLFAEAQTKEEASGRPLWSGPWQAPEPNRVGWDWIRLKSNEWVKGEILLMRDFDLHFDSDEFGIVEFDWVDVAEILTERVYIFVLQDMTTQYVGTMVMRDDQISVRVSGKIEVFDRSELLAITPSAYREFNLWSGRATVGIGLRSGNTKSSEITGRASLAREGANTRVEFEYNGVYGSFDKVKNTNNHRGSAAFDYFITPKFFLIPADFEAFSDEFQNIAYRLTPTMGAGYYFIRRPAVEWDVRLLTGYQHTRTDSAKAGDSATADNSAIVFGTTIDAELTKLVDLILDYQLQLITPDTEQTNHHAKVIIEFELTGEIDLDVSFIWDRIEDPETESDGNTPKTDDFRLSVGLALEF